jgi:hypothetical protein
MADMLACGAGAAEDRVVESGVCVARDSRGDAMATYGILVQNTSASRVASDAEVFVTIVDAGGRPITDRLKQTTQVAETRSGAVSPQLERVHLQRAVADPASDNAEITGLAQYWHHIRVANRSFRALDASRRGDCAVMWRQPREGRAGLGLDVRRCSLIAQR